MSIASKAARAAESVTSEPAAPASTQCCAAGERALAISGSTLAAEYTQMVSALNQATAELSYQAEANLNAWAITEQQIQQLATVPGIPGSQVANAAANLVMASAEATENSFSAAENTLSAEIVNAELAIQLAENVLSAEQSVFITQAGCNAEAETTAETTAAEKTSAEKTSAKR